MKLSNANLFPPIYLALQLGFLPTLRAVLQQPSLLFRPRDLSRVYMASVWASYGEGIDEGMREYKTELITPNAYGTVLEIGAAYGHTLKYLDKNRVQRYIALEPNTLMHNKIREKAYEAGYYESDGTLVILACGAEDTSTILSSILSSMQGNHLANENQPIDTIISILTLCTIPRPEETVTRLVQDVLKPSGYFLTFEHVLSHRPDVAWWQKVWAPVWYCAFDGCRLDRPSDVLMNDLVLNNAEGKRSAWKERKLWSMQDEQDEALFWHSLGVFIKQ